MDTTTTRKNNEQSLTSMKTLASASTTLPKALPVPSSEKRIKCIVEIISCRNLLATDADGLSDPYVEARFGLGKDSNRNHRRGSAESNASSSNEFLHRTNHQRNTLNPKFSSSFHLDCNAKSLYHMNGLKFHIFSKNNTKQDDDMGSAILPYEQLLKAENIPREYRITLDDDDKGDDDGGVGAAATTKKSTLSKSYKNVGFIKLRVMTIASKPSRFENLNCTIEIVSCRNLLAADIDGLSDPYVTIWLGDKKLHQTDHIKDTLNPYYYVTTKSKFDFRGNALEVFENSGGGLDVEVMDWDMNSTDDELGMTLLPYADIVRADGIPREYNLTIEQRDIKKTMTESLRIGDRIGDQEGNAGIVTIKCSKKTKKNKRRDLSLKSIAQSIRWSSTRKLNNPSDDTFKRDNLSNKRKSFYQKFSTSFRIKTADINRESTSRNFSDLTDEFVDEERTDFEKKKKNDLNSYCKIIFVAICTFLLIGAIIYMVKDINQKQTISSSSRQGGLGVGGELQQQQQQQLAEQQDVLFSSSSSNSILDNMIDAVYQEEQELKMLLKNSNGDY